MGRWVCSILGAVALSCSSTATPTESDRSDGVSSVTTALGEPQDGFPSWGERVIHVWSNRARANPAADLSSCSVCAESACYSPRPPLVWNHNLARAARFHSDNLALGGCSLQHNSPCTIDSSINTLYTPGSCNGDPSCACDEGAASCGASVMSWTARIGLFGATGNAENIASNGGGPLSAFYAWLWEPDSNTSCGFRIANGHRYNILSGQRHLGVGRSVQGTQRIYTQDFSSASATPDGIIAGVHYPETGTDLAFRANWFRSNGDGPTAAFVNVDGTCYPMVLERGVDDSNATYIADVTTATAGCRHYYFTFTDPSGTLTYPTTGSFGIGCGADWSATRPADCGSCTPDCTGRVCGNNGCGGSCGSCAPDQSCDEASGQCACTDAECDGACVDTNSDPNHCGGCDAACQTGEFCLAGTCQCSPTCGGQVCGDDGCGGSCGSCGPGETCNGGQCECGAPGYMLCRNECVDTNRERRNCGDCGVRCRGRAQCINGSCSTGACTPDCSGRECGDDGCGGQCTPGCGADESCDTAGQCICNIGLSLCGNACVSLATDNNHCGTCGNACGGSESCQAGVCIPNCTPDCSGKTCGDDGCGGTCGSCRAGQSCAAGNCMCPAGTTECGTTCANTDSDPLHCGGCDTPCAGGELCAGGSCSCTPTCDGLSCGDDGCGGTCGMCESDEVCVSGACACGGALTRCGAGCTDLRNDTGNCGSCGTQCSNAETCIAGSCDTSPGPDAGCVAVCDGRNCGDDGCGGSCGDCEDGRQCSAGLCSCGGAETACGAECVDLRSSSNHCGQCDSPCASDQACAGGVCSGGNARPDAGADLRDAGSSDAGRGDAGTASDSGTRADAARRDATMADGSAEPDESGSCGCRVHRKTTPDGSAGCAFALAALLFRRRRRRQRQ